MKNDDFVVGRDFLGIIPCYIGVSEKNEIYISNELKVIHDQCVSLEILKPGHYIMNNLEQI
jgi:asparagine synthetase B (glutamine-hydrolysing)